MVRKNRETSEVFFLIISEIYGTYVRNQGFDKIQKHKQESQLLLR